MHATWCRNVRLYSLCVGAILGSAVPCLAQPQALAIHRDNPHYFEFRGKPAFLITSGEHYGALLNLDFEAKPYLDELQACGFNLTRVFSGTYREVPGSFGIKENTLAPLPGRYLAPWARSNHPGAADGGNKFDLDVWDRSYFDRLKALCKEAGKRGIVIEFVLFCPYYEDNLWDVSPLNAKNNVNHVGTMPRTEVFTLKHPDMVARHEAFVRKVTGELREFDNVFYEICNEPYFGGVTLDWQARIASIITDAEAGAGLKHLIAQNIANGRARVENPNRAVSIFNFHYAIPPDTVGLNYDLNRVLGDDETGFKGNSDRVYRTEGWQFLLAGGGLYNNLDYSFTTTHEDGTAVVSAPTPGGGGPNLRRQLTILKDFLSRFDYVHMRPDTSFIKGGLPKGVSVQALTDAGRAYAIYIAGGSKADLVVELPEGKYTVEWLSPLTGKVEKTGGLDHKGGRTTLASPEYQEDVAVRITTGR